MGPMPKNRGGDRRGPPRKPGRITSRATRKLDRGPARVGQPQVATNAHFTEEGSESPPHRERYTSDKDRPARMETDTPPFDCGMADGRLCQRTRIAKLIGQWSPPEGRADIRRAATLRSHATEVVIEYKQPVCDEFLGGL